MLSYLLRHDMLRFLFLRRRKWKVKNPTQLERQPSWINIITGLTKSWSRALIDTPYVNNKEMKRKKNLKFWAIRVKLINFSLNLLSLNYTWFLFFKGEKPWLRFGWVLTLKPKCFLYSKSDQVSHFEFSKYVWKYLGIHNTVEVSSGQN